MRDSLLVGSPLAKEIENSASNRSPRDGQSPGEIMQKQPTVPPVQEQASSPSQSDHLLPHLFRLMQYSCKTASKSGHRWCGSLLMTFRVVLAKSSAFRRSVAGASEFARTGPIASIAFCASWSIVAFFTQGVVLLAIVVIPSFLRATEPFGIRSFTSFSQHIQESDRVSTVATHTTPTRSDRIVPSSAEQYQSRCKLDKMVRIGRQRSEVLLDRGESRFQLLHVRNRLFCTPLPVACSLTRFLFRHCYYSFL